MPVRYSVSATPHADDQLARLWTQATSAQRSAISRAAHRIDTELREDAPQKGVAMSGTAPGLRQINVPPLRAYFVVSEPDRRVSIIDYEQIP